MSEQEINDALDELRREIERLEVNDQAAKTRLTGLLESIEQRLTPSPPRVVEEDQPDLVEEVKDAITQFEVEHPRITGILNDIMMALSNLGI